MIAAPCGHGQIISMVGGVGELGATSFNCRIPRGCPTANSAFDAKILPELLALYRSKGSPSFGLRKSTAIGTRHCGELSSPFGRYFLSRLTVRVVRSLHYYGRILGCDALPFSVRHLDPGISPL